MKSINRQRLLASTLMASAAGFAMPAVAQDSPSTAAPSAQVGDPATRECAQNSGAAGCADDGTAIVVTGSRIASPTLSSASPLQIVDARDLKESGQLNVQNVLQENPAVSAVPTFSRTNTNFLTAGAGIASVDLRNLGTARTLVLINGHRTVSGVPGSNIVDLNNIPTPFIERVEVLTGGASSVYGSDAVAGVVNIIYRNNFEGLQLDGQSGITEKGDGATKSVSVMMGHNFDDGRGNITAYIGYDKEDGVYSSDRGRSAVDQNACYQVADSAGGCATEVGNGDNSRLFEAYRPFFSSFNPGGTITFGNLSRTIGAGGTLNIVNTNGLVHNNDGVSATVRGCTTADPCHPTAENATGFNRSAFRTIAVPVERYLGAFRGNYAITDHINASIEGNFAKTSSTQLIEPFAFQTSGVNGTSPNACIPGQAVRACGGFQPIQSLVNGVIINNPFVPAFILANATDRTGDGLKDISFTRRLADFGPRTFTAQRTSYRFLAGLNGDVFGNFKWDAFYTYGQTIESQVGSGQVNLASFANALEVIPGPNGPQCADPVARAQGCQPANIFGGPGSISAAAVNYIQAGQTRNVNIQQIVSGASISGNLFQLWDGPLGIAAGVEYRKESSSQVSDPLTTAGLNGGNATAPTAGSFNVKEAYAELAIPLLVNRPFFNTLAVRAAGRVSNYSLSAVGTVYSYNGSVEYAPIPDIRFRAVEARATRAPNIGELFGGRSQTFPTGLTDPCVGVTLTSTTAASAACRANPGVLNNIAANGGTFAVNQSDLQGISGFNSGNPNLKQETGDTFTVGAVINPRSVHVLRNFALTVDYFNIRIKNQIAAFGRQTILNNCYAATPDPAFCALITRRANAEGPNSPGSLQFINATAANLGSFKTTGLDVTLSYRQALSDWGLGRGTLTTKLAYTRLFYLDTPGETDAAGKPINLAGEEGSPWDRASGNISYNDKNFGFTLRGNFIGRSYLPYSFTGVLAGADASYRIKSRFTLDSQIRFTPGDHYEFFVGGFNLTNSPTPLLISGLPGDNTGTETDAGTYDPIGRRFYAGARIKF
ncbi:MAG: TonB-dependent receptor [Sphingomonas sp.]